MTPEGHNDLYPLLERHLKMAESPLTCHDLYRVPEIRAVAPSANRISDYLGVMFRRGQVSRVQALPTGEEEHGRARWAYLWREKITPDWLKEAKVQPVDYRPKPLFDRPNLHITEDGTHLNIEMPEISIQIQIRKK